MVGVCAALLPRLERDRVLRPEVLADFPNSLSEFLVRPRKEKGRAGFLCDFLQGNSGVIEFFPVDPHHFRLCRPEKFLFLPTEVSNGENLYLRLAYQADSLLQAVPAVLIGPVRDDDKRASGTLCAIRQCQSLDNRVVKAGPSAERGSSNRGNDLRPPIRIVRCHVHTLIELDVEELASFTCSSDKSAGGVFRPLQLVAVRHAAASIREDSQRDRLSFVREEGDVAGVSVFED